jgi:hypothetical protein
MQTLWNSATLDIAEPGAEFQSADAPGARSPLPTRRLIAAGCSTDHCLVYYERGGRSRHWFVALYRWTPAETRLEFGGTAPRDLKTIDDVRKAVLSGAIRPASPSSW